MASIASPEVSPSVEDSTTVITLPVVKHGSENKGILTFTLEKANVSIANALRRVLLSDIKTVVFNTDKDNINILKNTTRFHNEILKQRLGCIPINIKDPDGIENLQIELNMNNEKMKLIAKHIESIQHISKLTWEEKVLWYFNNLGAYKKESEDDSTILQDVKKQLSKDKIIKINAKLDKKYHIKKS